MSINQHFLPAFFCAALIASAAAQEKQPQATPIDPGRAHTAAQDLEPSVDTSATPDDPQPKTAPRATMAPAAAAKPPAPSVAAGQAKPKAGAKDRIDLDTTQITGNRELPKVMYIVPWKRSDLSDLGGRPSNSLLDEVLMPVDRDVFKRENRYYGALSSDAAHSDGSATGTAAPPASATATAPATRNEK
jgi:hypothetical protein